MTTFRIVRIFQARGIYVGSPHTSFPRACLSFLAGLTLFSSGCTSYEPPVGETNESSIVSIDQPGLMHHLSIFEIDGARTSMNPLASLVGGAGNIRVSPGYHQFVVQCASGGTTWTVRLGLTVEKNRTYHLQGGFDGLRFKAWFLHSGNPTPVGEPLPSND